MLQNVKFGQNPSFGSRDGVQTSFFLGQNLKISKCWCDLENKVKVIKIKPLFSPVQVMCLCKFGQNPPNGSGDRVQTRSYADADGIRTLISYLFTSSSSQKQNSAIRHHVSQGNVYTNTWPKVTDNITVSSNPNEPRQANLCLRAFRHDKFQLRMFSHSEGPGIWLSV